VACLTSVSLSKLNGAAAAYRSADKFKQRGQFDIEIGSKNSIGSTALTWKMAKALVGWLLVDHPWSFQFNS
jgi:hypothetical protein